MEHASVAAFARFTLQLTALGAPPDLLLATAAAMQDEIEHAQLAFTLVRRYGGRALGPGPLPVDDALAGTLDPLTIAELTIREACIGETIAAIEATRALEHATDPHVRAALERIAADELRHAELGWRFVAWLLRHADHQTRTDIERAFARALAQAPLPPPATPFTPTAAHHGVLDPESRPRIRQQALSEVITPLATALLARSTDHHHGRARDLAV